MLLICAMLLSLCTGEIDPVLAIFVRVQLSRKQLGTPPSTQVTQLLQNSLVPWQYLGTGDIEQRTVTQSWQYLCTGDIEQRTVTQSQK